MAGLVPPELMALASKVLGYGVVAGATFVKIPQARMHTCKLLTR